MTGGGYGIERIIHHSNIPTEIVPPWVQSNNDEPRAMPLTRFIDATIKILGTDTDEVLVEEAKVFRNNPGPNEGVFVTQLNDTMKSEPPKIH